MVTLRCLLETLGAATIAILSLVLVFPSISAQAPPPPMTIRNHTVGGAAGWFFNTSSNTMSANYSEWAASETFYRGDFLIFHTHNHTHCTVVQTFNETLYSNCKVSNHHDNQTLFWYNDIGGSTKTDFAIPLSYEGPNYFYSGNSDGSQCKKGMKFGINVLHASARSPSASPSASPEASRVEVMRGGIVWVGLGILSLVLMAV